MLHYQEENGEYKFYKSKEDMEVWHFQTSIANGYWSNDATAFIVKTKNYTFILPTNEKCIKTKQASVNRWFDGELHGKEEYITTIYWDIDKFENDWSNYSEFILEIKNAIDNGDIK